MSYGGTKVPDDIADMMKNQMFAQQALRQTAVKAGNAMLHANKNGDILSEEAQKGLEDALAAQQDRRRLEELIGKVEECRVLRAIVSKGVRGEDFDDNEREQLRRLIRGLEYRNGKAGETLQRQYRTLLRRVAHGEPLMFMDQHVFEKLRDDLDEWQGKATPVRVSKVEFDGNRIRARLEIHPDLPPKYIQMSVSVEGTSIDTVVDEQILPAEVMDHIVEKKLDDMMKHVQDVLRNEGTMVQERAWEDVQMDYLAPMRHHIPPRGSVIHGEPRRIEFNAFEFAGESIANPKALAKAITS